MQLSQKKKLFPNFFSEAFLSRFNFEHFLEQACTHS